MEVAGLWGEPVGLVLRRSCRDPARTLVGGEVQAAGGNLACRKYERP